MDVLERQRESEKPHEPLLEAVGNLSTLGYSREARRQSSSDM